MTRRTIAGLVAGIISIVVVAIIYIVLARISPIPLGVPPPVTCDMPRNESCPEVFWFTDISWTNDTPTISSIEFREVPPWWLGGRLQKGRSVAFEPEWAAEVENYFDPTQAAACHSDSGRMVCHYIEYGGDPDDLPWATPTTRERRLAWCKAPEKMLPLLTAARRLNLGQAPPPDRGLPTVFEEEYSDWQSNGRKLSENLDLACQAAYEAATEAWLRWAPPLDLAGESSAIPGESRPSAAKEL